MDLGLKGKVVLVSGSSRGIGRATALAFAQEGAKVAITGRTPSDVARTLSEVHKLGGEDAGLGVVADLRGTAEIRRCIDEVIGKWNRLDVLVANLGSGRGPAGWDVSDEAWSDLVELNMTADVRMARAAVPHLIATRGGALVFVASIAGLESLGAPAPYEAAKAALIAHSKYLAHALGGQVRVNVVAPGNVMFPGSPWDARMKKDPGGTTALIEKLVPLKRFGLPEEIADTVVFLASGKSSFTTGCCLVVDGGQTRAFA